MQISKSKDDAKKFSQELPKQLVWCPWTLLATFKSIQYSVTEVCAQETPLCKTLKQNSKTKKGLNLQIYSVKSYLT